MLSIDTSILLYAHNADCPENAASYDFISDCGDRDDIVLCELVLVELYLLLRNPAVVPSPLSAEDAVKTCSGYRRNPRWRLIENAPVMEDVWKAARSRNFPRRKIIDARLALTLRHHGVTEWATANTKDFKSFGFRRVLNPVE